MVCLLLCFFHLVISKVTANNIQIFAWNSRTMEDHEKNCVVLNAKKPQNLFLWRYIENTCILLLGERSKPAKKNLEELDGTQW